MYFGAHVKSSGGVWHAIENGVGIGAEAVQFFAGSPRTWAPTRLQGQGRGAVPRGARRVAHPLRRHPHHLPDQPGERERGLLREVGDVAVRRPRRRRTSWAPTRSSPTSARIRARASRPASSACRPASGAPSPTSEGSPVRLLLENTAGAGGTMGVDFLRARPDHRRRRRRPAPRRVPRHRAHLRVRRRPAHAPRAWPRSLERVDAGCGRERLVALHLNDSKTPLGSNRDRHENVGEGDLGTDGFRTIVNEPAFADLPGILEVPGFDGQGPDEENLARLRALVAG